jgi:hypothetical protein
MAMMSGALFGAADAALAAAVDATTARSATEQRMYVRMTLPPRAVSLTNA